VDLDLEAYLDLEGESTSMVAAMAATTVIMKKT